MNGPSSFNLKGLVDIHTENDLAFFLLGWLKLLSDAKKKKKMVWVQNNRASYAQSEQSWRIW